MARLFFGGLACVAVSMPTPLRFLFYPGICWAVTGAWMHVGGKALKLRVRDRFLGALKLQGSEAVLDVGCGRGLMLIGAAKRLANGRAVGLDLWRPVDQSGNALEVTKANAEAEGEGVAARVTLEPGDMTKMPFADASFTTCRAPRGGRRRAAKSCAC